MTRGGHEAITTIPVGGDRPERGGWPEAESWESVLGAASRLAIDYLSSLPDEPVSRHASPEVMAPRFDTPLPAEGCPPAEAIADWFARAEPGIVRSAGPRYFGFVTGGSTPAALAGDWLASAIDQNAFGWLSSPAAAQTEVTAIRWLLELFSLPPTWSGALTTGATMANLAGLAAARQWASHRLGIDAARDGLGGRPAIPVISSTEIHQGALKALGVLGLGRNALTVVPASDGAIDLSEFERALGRFDGPVIAVANAGEVNTGAFDPIRRMAELCRNHDAGAWLHVDGARLATTSLTHVCSQPWQSMGRLDLFNAQASDAGFGMGEGTGEAAAQVGGELLRVILTVFATVWGSFASPVLSVSPPSRSPCPVPTHRCDAQRHAGNHGDPHDGRGRSSRRPVARECRLRDPRCACSPRQANMSSPGANAARHPAWSSDATGQLGRRSAVR